MSDLPTLPKWLSVDGTAVDYSITRVVSCTKCWQHVPRDQAVRYPVENGFSFGCFYHEYDQEVLLD